jgi:hypothetical protein
MVQWEVSAGVGPWAAAKGGIGADLAGFKTLAPVRR